MRNFFTQKFFPVLSVLLLLFSSACAELQPLPLTEGIAPPPNDACYLNENEYRDESISVQLYEGDYHGIHYTWARIRISDPSQLRAVPAQNVYRPGAEFTSWQTNTASPFRMAESANAVIAVNGDFYTQANCHVVMRQCKQVRNNACGEFDVLIIDRNGDFDALPNCTRRDYTEYYNAHQDEMYQAFCFGPVLVRNGKSVITEQFRNGYMISSYLTQRMAICQLDTLEYVLITADGDPINYTFGINVYDFALLCEQIGRQLNPEKGFRMAYNLDGGNSATILFKRHDQNGVLTYQKVNMPERVRELSDLICFVSLVQP